jgi:hypothetical protein
MQALHLGGRGLGQTYPYTSPGTGRHCLPQDGEIEQKGAYGNQPFGGPGSNFIAAIVKRSTSPASICILSIIFYISGRS